MSVEINPSGTLGFHRPLTQLVKRTLTVTNPHSQAVAFKVKTTAPKQYCVRPNSGRIEPGEKVEVQVLLQPMQTDPELGAKCRDKFLVQSALITAERDRDRDSRTLSELWAAIDKEDKSSIFEHKIRCAYLAPLEDASTPSAPVDNGRLHPNGALERTKDAVGAAATADVGSGSKLARDDDHEDSKFDTVRSRAGSGGLPHQGRDSTPAPTSAPSSPSPAAPSPVAAATDPASANSPLSKDSVAAPLASAVAAVGLTSAASALSPASAAQKQPSSGSLSSSSSPRPASAEPHSVSELKAQLAEARKEIDRLMAQLHAAASAAEAPSGLRQRAAGTKPLPDAKDSFQDQAQAVVQGEAGVPFQTFALSLAGVFIFTWLFF